MVAFYSIAKQKKKHLMVKRIVDFVTLVTHLPSLLVVANDLSSCGAL